MTSKLDKARIYLKLHMEYLNSWERIFLNKVCRISQDDLSERQYRLIMDLYLRVKYDVEEKEPVVFSGGLPGQGKGK